MIEIGQLPHVDGPEMLRFHLDALAPLLPCRVHPADMTLFGHDGMLSGSVVHLLSEGKDRAPGRQADTREVLSNEFSTIVPVTDVKGVHASLDALRRQRHLGAASMMIMKCLRPNGKFLDVLSLGECQLF